MSTWRWWVYKKFSAQIEKVWYTDFKEYKKYIRKKVGFFLKENYSQEQKKERNKKIMRRIRVGLVLLFMIGGIAAIQLIRLRQYHSVEEVAQTPLYNNSFGYVLGNKELVMYSNDGARAVDKSGEVTWEMSYQLDKPEIAWCGDMTAVADIDGTSVYVMAENGIPYHYEVLYPIVQHEVAKQGVTAVLLNNGLDDYIQLYDINGNLRVDINTKTKVDGIPVDIALSEDGKKLVTLYVTFEAESMICKVTFYNAGEVGKNYISNMVGQKKFAENQLVYDVGFLNEDTVYVLYENGMSLYRMTEIPELLFEKTIEGAILDVACVPEGVYVILEEADKEKKLVFYNLKGEEKTVKADVPEYESFTATENEIIFFSPSSATIYRSNGSLKLDMTLEGSYEAMLPAGGDRYYLMGTGTVRIVKLTENEESEGEIKE